MRKFYLELFDKKGNPLSMPAFRDGKIALQLEDIIQGFDSFFTNFDGLGFENSNAYSSLGDGFFRKNESKIPQSPINGTIIIRNTRNYLSSYNELGQLYQTYRYVFNAIDMADKIVLLYDPYGNGTNYFKREVEIISVGKTEVTTDTVLEIPISFNPLTPWYFNDISVDVTSDRIRSMRYTYTYDDQLVYGDMIDAYRGIIVNDGSLPASLVVRIIGVSKPYASFINPIISLIDSETAEEIGRCEISTNINAREVIELSSIPLNSYVRRINVDGSIDDLIDYMSIEYDPFLRVPPGKTCELIIRTGSGSIDCQPEDIEVFAYRYTRVA